MQTPEQPQHHIAFGPDAWRRREVARSAELCKRLGLLAEEPATPEIPTPTVRQVVEFLAKVFESVNQNDRRARLQALNMMLEDLKRLVAIGPEAVDALFASVDPTKVHPGAPETLLLATRIRKRTAARDDLLRRFIQFLRTTGESETELERTRQRLASED